MEREDKADSTYSLVHISNVIQWWEYRSHKAGYISGRLRIPVHQFKMLRSIQKNGYSCGQLDTTGIVQECGWFMLESK